MLDSLSLDILPHALLHVDSIMFLLLAFASVSVYHWLHTDITYCYSRTSEQRKLWEQYKFSCCVFCREGVLFSEVQNVL